MPPGERAHPGGVTVFKTALASYILVPLEYEYFGLLSSPTLKYQYLRWYLSSFSSTSSSVITADRSAVNPGSAKHFVNMSAIISLVGQ